MQTSDLINKLFPQSEPTLDQLIDKNLIDFRRLRNECIKLDFDKMAQETPRKSKRKLYICLADKYYLNSESIRVIIDHDL